MSDSNNQKFNHLKIHTQYSICEGAIKIDKLKDFIIKSCKLNDEFNMYEVDTLKCALEPIKNKNKGIDKSLQEYLSEKEISDLSEFINKL